MIKFFLIFLFFINTGDASQIGPPSYISKIIQENFRNPKTASSPSEVSNQEHVLQLLSPLDFSISDKLIKLKFNFNAFWGGIVDSDLGKMKKYRVLLFEKSKDSDLLLSSLKGQGSKKVNNATTEIFKKYGFRNKKILNPNLSNDEIRNIFKQFPILTFYLHALPGVLENIKSFEKGEIDKESFQTRLGANLFHNGPTQPQLRKEDKNIFWYRFTNEYLPHAIFNKKSQKNIQMFFKGTLYEGKTKDGNVYPKYHNVMTFEGYVHCFFDRMSQGTRIGIIKIFNELLEKSHENRIHQMNDLLFSNPVDTKRQLELLKAVAWKDVHLLKSQKIFLKQLIQKGIDRLTTFIKYIEKNIIVKKGNYDRVISMQLNDSKLKTTFHVTHKNSIIMRGTEEKKFGIFTPEYCDEFKRLINEFLIKEESINGLPIRGLTL